MHRRYPDIILTDNNKIRAPEHSLLRRPLKVINFRPYLFLSTDWPFSQSTSMREPLRILPSSVALASWLTSSRWMSLLTGLAPYSGS